MPTTVGFTRLLTALFIQVMIVMGPLCAAQPAVASDHRSDYFPRPVVCQAMLQTMQDQGHTLRSIARRNTVDALRSFAEFRERVFQGSTAEPGVPEFLATNNTQKQTIFGSVPHATLAQRIAGLEYHFDQSESEQPTLMVHGTVISGQETIRKTIDRLIHQTDAVLVEASKFQHSSRMTGSALGLLVELPLIYVVAAAAEMSAATSVLFSLGAAAELLNIPRYLALRKNRDKNNWLAALWVLLIENNQPSLNPGTWYYVSRTDQVPKEIFRYLWDGHKSYSELMERAGDNIPLEIEAISNLTGLKRLFIQMKLAKEGRKKYLDMANVHTDILYSVDEEGEPHLVLGFRFEIDKPQVRRRNRQGAQEKDQVTKGVLAPAR